MKKILIFSAYMLFFITQAETYRDAVQYSKRMNDTSLILKILSQENVESLQKQWEAADENQKQNIVEVQYILFDSLFKQKGLSNIKNDLLILSKITRMTPISAPYQKRILKHITTMEHKYKKQLLFILTPYLVDINSQNVKYIFSTKQGETYTAYNTDNINVLFLSNGINLQLALEEAPPHQYIFLLEEIKKFCTKIQEVGIVIVSLDMQLREHDFTINLLMMQPNCTLSITPRTIEYTISEIPEKQNGNGEMLPVSKKVFL